MRRGPWIGIAAVAWVLATALCVQAGDDAGPVLLRWKLRAGQALVVELTQQTKSQVAFSGKVADTTIDLTMRLGWAVTAAADEKITIQQKIERVTARLTTPQGGTGQFDSAAASKASGPARQLADALQPLMGAEVEVTISPRGELLAARPLNKAAEHILAGGASSRVAGGAKADATDKGAGESGLSRTSLQQLLRQSFVVFPERKVAIGESWDSATDLETVAGPLVQTLTYRLADVSQQSGDTVGRLAFSAQLAPRPIATASATAGRVSLKSHEQQGSILFSLDRGYLTSAEQTQKLVTERPYRDVTIVVTLSSTQQTTVKTVE